MFFISFSPSHLVWRVREMLMPTRIDACIFLYVDVVCQVSVFAKLVC
jgi:hypothetical protein